MEAHYRGLETVTDQMTDETNKRYSFGTRPRVRLFSGAALVATVALVGPMSTGASASISTTESATTSTVQPAISNTQAVAAVDTATWVCTALGLGTSGIGVTNARAAVTKGASWVGIGATLGCFAWSEAMKVTPAEKMAAAKKAYAEWGAKSEMQKLSALGWSCSKIGGGGGGTDAVTPMAIGYTTIQMKGVKYRCGGVRD